MLALNLGEEETFLGIALNSLQEARRVIKHAGGYQVIMPFDQTLLLYAHVRIGIHPYTMREFEEYDRKLILLDELDIVSALEYEEREKRLIDRGR